jgi:hypothetical protein
VPADAPVGEAQADFGEAWGSSPGRSGRRTTWSDPHSDDCGRPLFAPPNVIDSRSPEPL